MKNKLKAIVFITILTVLCASFWLSPKKGYSENENRYLAQMPDFSAESLFDGSFTKGFEEYVTDGFPARDGWIALKSRVDLSLGRRDTGGVYVTEDGCLIEMFSELDRERYGRNLEYLRQGKGNLSAFGPVNIMLVPTAAEVWRGKIGNSTPDVSQRELLEEANGLLTVDCLSALEAHGDEYIYYRNDHHWTTLGAYYCYSALMGDKALPYDDFEHEILSRDFLGTTFSKAGIYFEKDEIEGALYGRPTMERNMSGAVTEGIYDRSFLDKKDKYSVFLGGNEALTVIRTGSEGGRLLLVKDSYANAFVQFLIPHYSEIHVVDLRSFGMSLSSYAEEAGITESLILYNLQGFSRETSVFRIGE